MTGEAWGHGVMQRDYYRHGFDAMINFDYQDQAAKAATCMATVSYTHLCRRVSAGHPVGMGYLY